MAGAAALGGIAALGVGAVKAAASGLKFNMSMENVTAQLNAFTKDGAKSAEILDMIKIRASKTPFAFEEMAKATAGLMPAAKASGEALESLVEQAEILAASNPAEGLEGAAFALREAVGGDFQSAIERFNLPRQFIQKLKDEGVPNIEILRRAMLEMGYDTDLVANLANTASGRWSTLLDTLTGIAAVATEKLFAGASSGLATLQGWLDRNQESINRMAVAVGERLGQAFDWLVNTGIPGVVGAFGALRQLANDISVAFEAGGLVGAIDVFLLRLRDLVPSLAPAIDFIRGPLNETLTWLRDVALPGARTAWETAWGAVSTIVGNVYGYLSGTVWPWLQTTAFPWLNDVALPALKTAWETAWNGVATVVGAVYGYLHDTVWPWLQNTAIPWLVDTGLPSVKTAFESSFNGAKQAVSDARAEIETVTTQTIPNAVTAAQGLSNAYAKDLAPSVATLTLILVRDAIPTWEKVIGVQRTIALETGVAVASLFRGGLAESTSNLATLTKIGLAAAYETLVDTWNGRVLPVANTLSAVLSGQVRDSLDTVRLSVLAIRPAISVLMSAWEGLTSDMTRRTASLAAEVVLKAAQIKSAMSSGWETVKAVVAATWNTIRNSITGPIEAAKGVVDRVIASIKSVIQSGIDIVNRLIRAINSIPAVPDIPAIPGLARGGPMDAGRPYVVGEEGPELVIPRSSGTVIPAGRTAELLGGGGSITVHVDARGAADPRAVGAAVRSGVRQGLRSTGTRADIKLRMRTT